MTYLTVCVVFRRVKNSSHRCPHLCVARLCVCRRTGEVLRHRPRSPRQTLRPPEEQERSEKEDDFVEVHLQFTFALGNLFAFAQMRGCTMPTWSTRRRTWTRSLRTNSVGSSHRFYPLSLRTSADTDSSSMGGTTYLGKVCLLTSLSRLLFLPLLSCVYLALNKHKAVVWGRSVLTPQIVWSWWRTA